MPEPSYPSVRRILDLARWAPSGDNTQPWRFELAGDDAVVVHGSDTRDWCVYDLEGHASQLALGALLETLAIAAPGEKRTARVERLPDSTEEKPRFRVVFERSLDLRPDPLAPYIEKRSTNRRPLSRAPLRASDRAALEASVGPGFHVVWVEGMTRKSRLARLLLDNAGVRLSIPEAYRVHKRIIEWDAGFSEDRIPDRSLGLNPAAIAAMKWALGSWKRVTFMNRYLGGTVVPGIEMDLVPALACAAHFFIVSDAPPDGIDAWVRAGRATQRFWLTATSLGLQFQPETTPVIFSDYVRRNVRFTNDERAQETVAGLRRRLIGLLGESSVNGTVFAGRIGYGQDPRWRSLRLPLERLMLA